MRDNLVDELHGEAVELVRGNAHAEAELGVVLEERVRPRRAASVRALAVRGRRQVAAVDRRAARRVRDEEPVAANLGEDEYTDPSANEHYNKVAALAAEENAQVLPICAKLEADIAELDDDEEKQMFMEELGIEESGLDKLIKCSYDLLGLMSFLTAGSDECRAWTIKKGTKAPQAAGKIHSDFERGFIRAEVISYQDLKENGSLANARTKGLVRSEGKEYVMQDGDVVNFLFNVEI